MVVSTLRACECPRCHGRHFEPTGAVNPCLLCEGRGYVEDCALSDHFRFGEMVHTAHHEFPNDPDAAQIENLRRLCLDLLEPVRAVVGSPLRVTSGYRSRSLDAHVAGPEWAHERLSAHAIGSAADVQPVRGDRTLRDVMTAVTQIPGLGWDQAIYEGGCVHLALFAPTGLNRQRRQLLVRLANPDKREGAARYIYARWDASDAQVAAAV